MSNNEPIIYDNYELWEGYTFRQEEGLTEAEIEYWAQFHRWPLVMAVYLSMGQIPFKKSISGKLEKPDNWQPDPTKLAQLEDFENRLAKAMLAARTGELVIEKIPDTRGMGHPYVERLVPVKSYINWATSNYDANYTPLFDRVIETYQSPEHTVAGKQGNKAKEALLDRIKDHARYELDEGCRCQHNELAKYLRGLKRGDKFAILEERKSRKGKQPTHEIFLEAVTAVFEERDLPSRFEKKPPGQERGKKLCDRHREET